MQAFYTPVSPRRHRGTEKTSGEKPRAANGSASPLSGIAGPRGGTSGRPGSLPGVVFSAPLGFRG